MGFYSVMFLIFYLSLRRVWYSVLFRSRDYNTGISCYGGGYYDGGNCDGGNYDDGSGYHDGGVVTSRAAIFNLRTRRRWRWARGGGATTLEILNTTQWLGLSRIPNRMLNYCYALYTYQYIFSEMFCFLFFDFLIIALNVLNVLWSSGYFALQ